MMSNFDRTMTDVVIYKTERFESLKITYFISILFLSIYVLKKMLEPFIELKNFNLKLKFHDSVKNAQTKI